MHILQCNVHLLCSYLINCYLTCKCHVTFFSFCKDLVMDVVISFCSILFMNTSWRMSPHLISGSEYFYFSSTIALYLACVCLVNSQWWHPPCFPFHRGCQNFPSQIYNPSTIKTMNLSNYIRGYILWVKLCFSFAQTFLDLTFIYHLMELLSGTRWPWRERRERKGIQTRKLLYL